MRQVLFNAQQGHIAMQEIWQYCKAQLTAGKRVVLEAKLEKRSGAQNRRYWGNGVLKQIAEQAVVNGRLYSAETWHEQFKRMFIGIDELPNGEVIGKSSTELTKAEFSDFCTQVEAYAVQDLGVVFYDLQQE